MVFMSGPGPGKMKALPLLLPDKVTDCCIDSIWGTGWRVEAKLFADMRKVPVDADVVYAGSRRME